MPKFTETYLAHAIARGMDAGKSQRQIAWELGLSQSRVSRLKIGFVEAGLLGPEYRGARCGRRRYPKVHPHRLGALAPLIQSLEPKILDWMHAQIPDGGTYNEFLVACMIEVYQNEQEQAK